MNYIQKRNYITIIGGGNLGRSIAVGLLNSKYTNKDIYLTKRNIDSIKHLTAKNFIVTKNNKKASDISKYVILCVEPRHAKGVIKELHPVNKNYYNKKKTLISCVAGLTIAEIETMVDPEHFTVARAMPNTATCINKGLTCLTNIDAEGEKIFQALGHTERISEDLMQSATIMGACGVAYAMKYIRAATQGGVEIGFNAAVSQRIVEHTVGGAVSLLHERGTHPEYEIDKVATPNGCTISGLNEMEHHGFSSATIKGIKCAYAKTHRN